MEPDTHLANFQRPIDLQARKSSITYADSLTQLSRTPAQPELYTKVQNQVLARFLSSTSGYQHDEWPDAEPSYTLRQLRPDHGNFIHVVVHAFAKGQNPERHDFRLENGLANLLDFQPQVAGNQVVLVRGSLSLAWVAAPGTKYKIDPEFFRRHLSYLPGRAYSELPALPSSNNEMMTFMLPYGFSFLGAFFSDAKLLGLAYALEQRTLAWEWIRPYILPKTELEDVAGCLLE